MAFELDWRRRLKLALDAAKGMHYLHTRQPPVLHRDLKSANLLVDKHWQAKVADFNLSRVMQPSTAVSSLAASNPRCSSADHPPFVRYPVSTIHSGGK